jgi:hypothetical protein
LGGNPGKNLRRVGSSKSFRLRIERRLLASGGTSIGKLRIMSLPSGEYGELAKRGWEECGLWIDGGCMCVWGCCRCVVLWKWKLWLWFCLRRDRRAFFISRFGRASATLHPYKECPPANAAPRSEVAADASPCPPVVIGGKGTATQAHSRPH